jgi:SAM-dependent methyltransferase
MREDGHLRQLVAEFYREERVVRRYLTQRYAGAAGERVSSRELGIVAGLLPPGGRVLDVGCGTGRLGAVLGSGHEAFGVDLSPAMLRETRRSGRYVLALGDAFALPFADGSFDATVALRLLFHFPDPAPILRELARVTRPGGLAVIETSNWSPRARRALDAERWGPPVFVHRRDRVADLLTRTGLTPCRAVDAFLLSPVLYSFLPPSAGAALEWLESRLPRAWRCRTYWQAIVRNERP